MTHDTSREHLQQLREAFYDTLVRVAMANMTIPQAKVFALKVQLYADLYLEKAIHSTIEAEVSAALVDVDRYVRFRSNADGTTVSAIHVIRYVRKRITALQAAQQQDKEGVDE